MQYSSYNLYVPNGNAREASYLCIFYEFYKKILDRLVLPSVSYDYNEGIDSWKVSLGLFYYYKFAMDNYFSAHFAILQWVVVRAIRISTSHL